MQTRYLSSDIESTGLTPECRILEFSCVPFDVTTQTIREDLAFSAVIKCPSFEELEPELSDWVKNNNKPLINRSHQEGISMDEFKARLTAYLESPVVKEFFAGKRIIIFGKSLSSIDIPFLTRDLGWDFMNKYFMHYTLDLSSVVQGLRHVNHLPSDLSESSSGLMKYFKMGEVAHTSLADAINTAKLYFKVLNFKKDNA